MIRMMIGIIACVMLYFCAKYGDWGPFWVILVIAAIVIFLGTVEHEESVAWMNWHNYWARGKTTWMVDEKRRKRAEKRRVRKKTERLIRKAEKPGKRGKREKDIHVTGTGPVKNWDCKCRKCGMEVRLNGIPEGTIMPVHCPKCGAKRNVQFGD